MSHKEIKLNPSQWEFLTAEGYDEYALWGGQGGGKSYVGLLKMLTHMHATPRSSWWACRRTISQGKQSLFTDFIEKTVPSDWITRINEAERIVGVKSHLCKHTIHQFFQL